MFVIASLILVDFLLPSVHIPAFAWALILLLWVCKKAVQGEAKRSKAPKEEAPELPISALTEIDWITSKDGDSFSTPDGDWQIVNYEDRKFLLQGDANQFILLTAETVGAAMDQADFIIRTLTPEE